MTTTGRRSLAGAVVLAALGLLLVAVAVRARWGTLLPADPELPGSAPLRLTGSTLVPSLLPLALVGAAGVLAAAAAGRMLRGLPRVAASGFVVLAGLALISGAALATRDPATAARHLDPSRTSSPVVVAETTGVGWVAVAGGALIAFAGVAALVGGRSWPGLAARYERDPAAPTRTTAAPASPWDAIERGDDPTR